MSQRDVDGRPSRPGGRSAGPRTQTAASRKRILLAAVVVSLVATAAVAIGILLFSSFGETSGRILGTTFCVALASLLALPGAVLLDQGRSAGLGATTLALALLELVLGTVAIWTAAAGAGKLAGTGLAVTAAAVQTSALAAGRRAGDPERIARLFAAATGAAAVVATMVVVAIWTTPSGSGYFRVLGALAVADVLLAVLQPVLRRGSPAAAAEPQRLRLTLADGSTVETERAGADFADAAARAIRRAERGGAHVRVVERLGP